MTRLKVRVNGITFIRTEYKTYRYYRNDDVTARLYPFRKEDKVFYRLMLDNSSTREKFVNDLGIAYKQKTGLHIITMNFDSNYVIVNKVAKPGEEV